MTKLTTKRMVPDLIQDYKNLLLTKVFSEQDHADQFLQGKLLARRVDWFKQFDNNGRGDSREGAVYSSRDSISSVNIWPKNQAGVSIPASDLGGPVVLGLRQFDYYFLYCMCARRNDNYCVETSSMDEIRKKVRLHPRCLEEFGPYAVVVRNPVEFIEKVRMAMKHKNFRSYCAIVEYFDPNLGTDTMLGSLESLFMKRNSFSWQSEFRIVIDTTFIGLNQILLHLGRIDDIAVRVNTLDLISS